MNVKDFKRIDVNRLWIFVKKNLIFSSDWARIGFRVWGCYGVPRFQNLPYSKLPWSIMEPFSKSLSHALFAILEPMVAVFTLHESCKNSKRTYFVVLKN